MIPDIRNQPYTPSRDDLVVTCAGVGDLDEVGYSIVFRSGPDFTDILVMEHVDRTLTKKDRYRSDVTRW